MNTPICDECGLHLTMQEWESIYNARLGRSLSGLVLNSDQRAVWRCSKHGADLRIVWVDDE